MPTDSRGYRRGPHAHSLTQPVYGPAPAPRRASPETNLGELGGCERAREQGAKRRPPPGGGGLKEERRRDRQSLPGPAPAPWSLLARQRGGGICPFPRLRSAERPYQATQRAISGRVLDAHRDNQSQQVRCQALIHAGVVELVDTRRLKPGGPQGREGSNPSPGTPRPSQA